MFYFPTDTADSFLRNTIPHGLTGMATPFMIPESTLGTEEVVSILHLLMKGYGGIIEKLVNNDVYYVTCGNMHFWTFSSKLALLYTRSREY